MNECAIGPSALFVAVDAHEATYCDNCGSNDEGIEKKNPHERKTAATPAVRGVGRVRWLMAQTFRYHFCMCKCRCLLGGKERVPLAREYDAQLSQVRGNLCATDAASICQHIYTYIQVARMPSLIQQDFSEERKGGREEGSGRRTRGV